MSLNVELYLKVFRTKHFFTISYRRTKLDKH